MKPSPSLSALSLVWLLAGCYSGLASDSRDADDHGSSGDAASGSETGEADDDGTAGEVPTIATHGGLRRLSVFEYDNALFDLLGDDSRPGSEFLPEDALRPFDNDYALQAPSEALILGAEKLATEAADRLLADPARLEALAGCTPEAASDVACLRELIVGLGRRAFRRPLENEEIEALATLAELGHDAGSWHVAAAAVVRVILQDPNFLYRVEIGQPVGDDTATVELDDWEIATRLSFFLWASIPDDALLDLASADGLSSEADVRAQARAMLADARARKGVARFHAMWLGYSRLGSDGLAADMSAESNALVERIVFDDEQAWLTLLTSAETFVAPTLAAHYGLPPPAGAGAGWIDYGTSGRGGILSHGSVLALGSKFGDTSPTRRGAQLRERLFCQTIEVPEDLEVNTDDPPGVDPAACKWDRYAAHREAGGCAGCHALIDGIGFGLENYGADGAPRRHDVGKPECEISGDGEVVGVGTFNGPAELGALLVDLPDVRRCAMRQLYRFASGRGEPDALDIEYLAELAAEYDGRELVLAELMVEIAASDAFRFRTFEEEE
jgi:hypothetical protein